MECCLSVISRHVSIREYTSESIPEEHVKKIIEASRRAPSAWGLQPYTIIIVRDPRLKKDIAEAVGGQEHVAKAPLLLVYAIDYAKLVELAKKIGVSASDPGLGHLIIGLVDVGIASAWASIVAEELGYGITFIALYSNPCRIAKILGLPKYVLPAVALTIGKPARRPGLQPRQPVEALIDHEKYGDTVKKADAMLGDRELMAKYRRVIELTLKPNTYYDLVGEEMYKCIREYFNVRV